MSSPRSSRILRLSLSALSVVLLLAVLVAGWFYVRLRGTLPALDGEASVAGLGAPATIERDALGVVTVRGASRADVARALGFVHAQERFFQMDLQRRRAAGELSELFGDATLPIDKRTRAHGFRNVARQVVAGLPAAHRALLDAYAAGVNAGLAALGAEPWEYSVVRADAAPWTPEDSVLVIFAMTLDLQDETAEHEQSLAAVRDTLGRPALAFFAPLVGPADAALDGTTAPLAPIPGPNVIDLRPKPGAPAAARPTAFVSPRAEELVPGSNAFALAGGRTAGGGGLLASDMHLGLGVPNLWFRARLEWPAGGGAGAAANVVTGLTLPGLPLVVAGGNGRIVWGFTNAYVDTSDLVVVDAISDAPELFYARGRDMVEYEQRKELIRVKGDDPVETVSVWTAWGPVVATGAMKRPLALKWTAHDPAATNLDLFDLETATDAKSAVAVAHRAGMPAQNFLVADRDGAVAWTIAGRIPKRRGHDGRLPISWSYGDRGWDGFLTPEETPVVYFAKADAPGQLWSANARALGGDALARLGDGGYAAPFRAARIRDLLTALAAKPARPADLLAVQLDDAAPHLARWQARLVGALTDEAVAARPDRREIRELVSKWEGRATIDSVSYRLVAAWRRAVAVRVLTPICAPCLDVMPDFSPLALPYEEPLNALLDARPAHLLSPEFASWDAVLLAALDDVLADLKKRGVAPAEATWGAANTTSIRHPFSRFLPGPLATFLDMPAEPLPGARDVPRVQAPAFGASARFVVEPGREAEGILHMPAGQSAHPLSPFYRAGHEAWARGEPTPFLPGETRHTLTLRP